MNILFYHFKMIVADPYVLGTRSCPRSWAFLYSACRFLLNAGELVILRSVKALDATDHAGLSQNA